MAISSRPPLEAEMREEVFLSNHGALTGLQTGEEQICTGRRAVCYFVFIFFIFLNGE